MRSLLALMIVLAAACGDDAPNKLPDAPVFEDGPPDGQTSGLVKLTITVGTTPRPDIKVYFQNSDSTLVAAATTDASGVASAVMEPGGFVTAIDPFPSRGSPAFQFGTTGGTPPSKLKTFAGVKPGDELVLHETEPDPTIINFTLLANTETSGNAATYLLFGPCIQQGGIDVTPGAGSGSGAVGGALSLQGCGATTDFTIVAFDVSGVQLGFVHKPNLPLSEAGTVDMTDVVYAIPDAVTFEYTNVPAGIGSFNVFNVLTSSRGLQFDIFDGAVITSNTGITPTRSRPAIPDTLSITHGFMFGGANGIHNILEWGPPATTYSKSLATTLLTEFTSFPTYDLTQKAITWTIDPVGGAPDLIVAGTDFQRDTPSLLQWSWDLAAPATDPATVVRYPVLPSPDDQFNPTVADAFPNVGALILGQVPGGYDAVREHVLSLDDPATGLPLGLVVGPTGQVVFQEATLGEVAAARAKPSLQRVTSPFAHRLVRKRR